MTQENHVADARQSHDASASTIAPATMPRDSANVAVNAQAMRGALSQLAGVMQGSPPDLSIQNADASRDPLLAACQSIGDRLNLVIKPPVRGSSERAPTQTRRDPLGEIARASRVRVRRVGLRGRWWT